MIGRRLSHFQIIEQIGAGGMGVVYRARDERLQRDVAIKILPPQMLKNDASRRRFQQEALALSRINHPNIATIFDVGREEDVDFLVMEYIPGQSIDERLTRGPIPESEALRIAADLARGLSAAHDQGVLHRDLKPANLRLTSDGRLKILDFGLARLMPLEPAAVDASTDVLTQGISGTLPYMAPEQLIGQPVDNRTDLHAAGAVLYEMVTARRAYNETQPVRLTDAILHQNPPSPREMSPRISQHLERIILRSLQKNPDLRYQSARDLLADLQNVGTPQESVAEPSKSKPVRRIALAGTLVALLIASALALLPTREKTTAVTPSVPRTIVKADVDSLAVLPFVSMSPEPKDEYFADGITEELINALANTDGLRVVSRSSSFAFKGKDIDARDIARKLNVAVLLEGSVRKQEDRLRITAQLIRASDGYHIWSETFDRKLDDVFAIQKEISQSIVAKIRPTARTSVEPPTASLEAYQLYLQAKHLILRSSITTLRESLPLLDRAVALDPHFAEAWVQKAVAYRLLVARTGMRVQEGLPLAMEAAQKATALDPGLGEAHAALGEIHISELRWEAGERSLLRAIELSPNSAAAHYALSNLLLNRGKHAKALEEAKRAFALDPVTRISAVGRVHYYAGQYAEALPWFLRAIEANPASSVSHYYLGMTYGQLRREQEAITAMQRAVELSGDQRWRTHLAHIHALTGSPARARRLLSEVKEATPSADYPRVDFAKISLALGDRGQALSWLEEAHQQKSPDINTIFSDVELKPLFGEPRFQELLRNVGLFQESSP